MDVLFPFGAQHTACGVRGPSQELNPGPGRESTGSSPLDHQGTPPHFSTITLLLLTMPCR